MALPPVLVTAAIATVYLIVQPRTVDLAASVFRAPPVRRGRLHDLEQHLVLGPPDVVVQRARPAARVAALARRCSPRSRRSSRPRCSSRSPAGTSASAPRAGVRSGSARERPRRCFGRVTFAAGGRRRSARCSQCRAAGECSRASSRSGDRLLSPIAGLFLALAAFAYALTAERRSGLALTAAALAPAAVMVCRVPGRRRRAVRVLGVLAGAAVRARLLRRTA